MALDLAKTNLSEMAEAGYKFELTMPGTDEPLGAFIVVRGDEAPKVKAYGKKIFREMQNKDFQAQKKGRVSEPMSIEEAEAMAVDGAFVRMISWEGIEEEGKPVKFDEENVKRVLKQHSWIRQQVMDASSEISNFT